jgi:hypothetical protein
VQVYRVRVVCSVLEDEPIPPPCVQSGWRAIVTFPIDRPLLDAVRFRDDPINHHRQKLFLWQCNLRRALSRDCVIPGWVRRANPVGISRFPRLFDNGTHTSNFALVIVHRAENPNTWIPHFDEGADALSGTELKDFHRLRQWHRL